MSSITFREYRPGDEQQLVRLWNQSLVYDTISQERFRNLILLDANFDPEGMRLAFANDLLIGCVYAIRRQLPMIGTDLEPENGWIPFFFVDQQFRKQRVGARLLEEALQFFQKHNRKNIYFASYAPNYIFPGIDEKAYVEGFQFLLKHGFVKQYTPCAMDISLVNFVKPAEVNQLKEQRISEGYSFGQAKDHDLYELIQFASNVFNPDWGRAIREGVLRGLPLSRIFIVRKAGKMAGFCLYGGYEGIRERFGPFGVDPEIRGAGLGKILLYDCLEAMRSEGLHGAWFLWTGETTPAGYLYKKVGFEITREFHVMCKKI